MPNCYQIDDFQNQDDDEMESDALQSSNSKSDRNLLNKQDCKVPVLNKYLDNKDPVVKWIVENFQPAEGSCLRRSTIYNLYVDHCSQLNQTPINSASFGKLMRSVFIGLGTRRLGMRGHSKYHYYGLTLTTMSTLNFEESCDISSEEESNNNNSVTSPFGFHSAVVRHTTFTTDQFITPSKYEPENYLDKKLVQKFANMYKAFCRNIHKAVATNELASIQQTFKEFWKNSNDFELENEKLWSSTHIKGFVISCDRSMFQRIIHVVFPSTIDNLTDTRVDILQLIGSFIKSCIECNCSIPDKLILNAKLVLVDTFHVIILRSLAIFKLSKMIAKIVASKTLREDVLNELKQASHSCLQNSWLIGSMTQVMHIIQHQIETHIFNQYPIETWFLWSSVVIDVIILPESKHKVSKEKALKLFILTWYNYRAQIGKHMLINQAKTIQYVNCILQFCTEIFTFQITHRLAALNQLGYIDYFAQWRSASIPCTPLDDLPSLYFYPYYHGSLTNYLKQYHEAVTLVYGTTL
ncbi:hypothetical protein GJ496_000945 [Pomphorhynchus laevis]|nr:hypothetical protein GJ496_000945 [Pomphorhynchus laevis]